MTKVVQIRGTMGKVLTCLKQTGDGVSVENIAFACGITKNAAKGALARLLTHGLVMRTRTTSQNKWMATPPTLAGDPPPHMPPLHGTLPSA